MSHNSTSFTPSLIIRVAIGACPWPSERAWNLEAIPVDSASCSSELVGSTPGESTKMSGVFVVESSTTWDMSRTGGSVNFDPRLLTMKEVAQNATLSGLRERTISILCSSLHALSHSPGSPAVSGSELVREKTTHNTIQLRNTQYSTALLVYLLLPASRKF